MFRNAKPKRRNIYSVTLSARYEILTEADNEQQAKENVAAAAKRLKLDYHVTAVTLRRHAGWVEELKTKRDGSNGSSI